MSPTASTSKRLPSSPTWSSWTRRRSSPTKGFPRTSTTMTLHSRVCFAKLTEYVAITLNEKTCLSVCRRQCPTERSDLLGTARRPAEQSSQEAQIRTLLDKQNEHILAECQARINRHEFQAAYDRRSLLKLGEMLNFNEKNFIALELKKLNREINNFFKNSYCSKIWNYVKLTRKVSPKWKSYRSFSVLPSILLQDED